MNHRLAQRLHDALSAITAIEEFLSDQSLEKFLSNPMILAAVERKFEVIGEALKKAAELDGTVESWIPELRQIVATRNRIIHGYDDVDHLILWDVVQSELPGLKHRLLVALDFPNAD